MSNPSIDNPLDKAGPIVAAIAISVIGALFYNLLPIVLGTAQDYRQLDNQQIGLIGSAFYAGYTLVVISAFFWIRRINWRLAAYIAMPIAAAGMYLGTLNTSYPLLLISVFMAGGAFSAVYGLGTTALGDTTHATKWFGVKIAVEAGSGVILLFMLPGLIIKPWGFDGLLIALAIIVLLFIPFVYFLPARGHKGELEVLSQEISPANSSTNLFAVWAAIAATAFFFTGETAAWAFIERIGNDAGFEAELLGRILALTLIFAVLGSCVVAAIGERFGYHLPIVTAGLIFFAGLLCLTGADHLMIYILGCCVVMFSVGFGIPLYVSFVAHLDLDGRYVVLTVPAIGFGAMVGPGAAGSLSQHFGLIGVILFGAAFVAIAMALVLAAMRNHSRVQNATMAINPNNP